MPRKFGPDGLVSDSNDLKLPDGDWSITCTPKIPLHSDVWINPTSKVVPHKDPWGRLVTYG